MSIKTLPKLLYRKKFVPALYNASSQQQPQGHTVKAREMFAAEIAVKEKRKAGGPW